MSTERGGLWICVPFIQQHSKVANAVIETLSSGGSSGQSTFISDGKSIYPPNSDQIIAFSSGSWTNRTKQTSGQPNSAT